MEEKQTEVTLTDQAPVASYYGNKESFEHVQRIAVMFSKSDLVPKRYQGNVGNCIIALEMAGRIGASPLMVMQNLDVIQGKPGWSSTFLIACINQSGKFSPLRYEEDEEEGGRTRAWAIDKFNNEKVFGIWVSMKMAEGEGWVQKNGSKWKNMPDLMRRYRAATFFQRQFAPEIGMGLLTQDEIIDISPAQLPAIEELRELYQKKAELLTTEEDTHALRIMNNLEESSYQKLKTLLNSK